MSKSIIQLLGNILAVQVAVHTLDLCVIGVHLLNNHRDRVIQLLCNVMAAMAGDQFQTAALTGSGLDRLIDAVGLNGIIQVFL